MKTRCVSVAKTAVMRAIREFGAHVVLCDFDGTDEEAIQMVRDSPLSFFTLGRCDNKTEDGLCLGHEEGEA
jgi:hypothetical protein